jgi:hypothetical protein
LPRSPSRSPPRVGEGDGDGDGDGDLDVGFDVGSLVARSDDRLDVVGDGLGDGEASLVGSSVVGLGDCCVGVALKPTDGAAALAPGTRGRAETGDEPACSELVNVTTVATATVDITAAAANLYSFVGGTVELPGTRTMEVTTATTVAGTTSGVTSKTSVTCGRTLTEELG